MSFPSIRAIANERGLDPTNLGTLAAEVLLEAVRRDCPEAVRYLHGLAHQAEHTPEGVFWSEDPGSMLGRQLIRIHASDAVRPLVEKHVCHGMPLVFMNCCNGRVGGPPPKVGELIQMQIDCQNGVLATADC